jgi:hypothetical protein
MARDYIEADETDMAVKGLWKEAKTKAVYEALVKAYRRYKTPVSLRQIREYIDISPTSLMWFLALLKEEDRGVTIYEGSHNNPPTFEPLDSSELVQDLKLKTFLERDLGGR